jgi:hypothetical protein
MTTSLPTRLHLFTITMEMKFQHELWMEHTQIEEALFEEMIWS